MQHSLADTCVPRKSVFDPSIQDTVYSIDDLTQIDPRHFFEENFVTNGMKQLLTETFKRLEGRSQNGSGVFLLSQAMGGGKTHNLLALGLLAKHPYLRSEVMGSFYTPESREAISVVTFSGRNTNTPYGIWGEIAKSINKQEVFSAFYTPLMPPSDTAWVELLRGEPVLLMLDELPPYFEAMRARPVGSTTLDTITTTALSNLFNAIASGKLPNVCLVLTDLRASSYGAGSAAMNAALQDLSNEANRLVTRIDPVRLNSDELYDILRTRLFVSTAGPDEVDAVAAAYGHAIAECHAMGLTTTNDAQERARIKNSYPFHYGIRDLFARFKENPSFQQTRALIRIMRTVVAGLWSSQSAQTKALISAEDINLLDGDIISEIRQINSALDAAMAHDLVADGGQAVAQQIDGSTSHDACDAATLIFLSSLSLAVNPTLGLSRSDIVAYLAAPGRDVVHLNKALDELQLRAWYLHATAAGALLFKNTENLNAKLEGYAQSMLPDQRETELRTRLGDMYAPKDKRCYGQIQALPALDQVQPNPDTVMLVIFRPSSQARGEIEQFYTHLQLKNRVLFLTGEAGMYDRVLESSAYLRAIGVIIAELQRQNLRDGDPQLTEAHNIETKQRSNFYQACREAFRQLFYPSRDRLTDLAVEPAYTENSFEGEKAIVTALQEAYKYDPNAGPNSQEFVGAIVKKLWSDAKEMPWAEVKKRAATDPSWRWHHPRALEDTRREMVLRDQWRDIGNDFVARGPFPPPMPSVLVQMDHRDHQTGEATLRVKPLHGDVVYCTEPNNPATPRRKLEALVFSTKALRLEFVAENLTEKLMGDPTVWTNTITLKYQFSGSPGNLRCELQALPGGEIRFTTDGSSPTNGQIYHEPFYVPAGARFIQAQASAEGVLSNLLRADLPREAPRLAETPGAGAGATYQPVWHLDPAKSATWKKVQRCDSTAEVFTFLENAAKHEATLANVTLTAAASDNKWVQFVVSESWFVASTTVLEQAARLRDLIPGATLSMDVMAMRFTQGQQLEELTHVLRATLQQDEVEQS